MRCLLLIAFLISSLSFAQQAAPTSFDQDDTADLEELSANKFSMPKIDNIPNMDPAELEGIMKNLDKNPLFKMMDKKQKETAAIMMKHNPFQNMKKSAIKSSILNIMDAEKPAGKFLHNNPKVVDTIAEIAVDEKALPAFVSIMNKPDKMKTFGFVVIAVFITVFVLNLKNSKSNILKRLFFKICLMLGSMTINLGAFYFIFRDELKPTVDIVMRTL